MYSWLLCYIIVATGRSEKAEYNMYRPNNIKKNDVVGVVALRGASQAI